MSKILLTDGSVAGGMMSSNLLFSRMYLTLLFLLCCFIGLQLTMLYSVAGGDFFLWAAPQLIRFLIFFLFMVLISFMNIKILYQASNYIYVISILLLLFSLFKGYNSMGATRWVKIFGFNFQPSELCKISLILVLARFFHKVHLGDVNGFFNISKALLLIFIPVILIARQPDLGTAIVLCLIGVMLLFAVGVSIRKFIMVGISGICIMPIFWYNMYDYQKNRVISFINPYSDPLGSGYNSIQSKIAIGSGGIAGKGLLQGSQNQLRFLPEKHTDFIFTIVCEELGFIGAGTLIFMYIALIFLCFLITSYTRSFYAKMVAFGVGSYFFLHIMINIAMVMGLLPVVGVPLPFMSYGGSFLMMSMIAFSLILNVYINRNNIIPRF